MSRRPPFVLLLLAAALLAGCGLAHGGKAHSGLDSSSGHSAPASATTTGASGTPSASATAPDLTAAETVSRSEFPTVHGRTLTQLAKVASTTAQFEPATSTFTPGSDRLAFAITASTGQLLYAPSAVYVAPSAGDPATGPYPAPADPLTVAPQYRSKQYIGPGDIQAIYHTNANFARPGDYALLVLSRTRAGWVASRGTVAVAPSTSIPSVGQRPPDIATDTLATTHGNISLLTTRLPPESMHSVSFNQVLGKKPIALLFSTPGLCTSRVCGPVTDVIVSLQHEFQGRITFIHEEIYVDNQPAKGLRSQMKAFHLHTEPWLFTITRHGRIAARLEGAFGVREATAALQAALR